MSLERTKVVRWLRLCRSADRSTSKAPMGAPLRIGEACSFHAFRASNYKLHFLESPSGLKMVLNTDQDAGDLREHLQAIYLQVRLL